MHLLRVFVLRTAGRRGACLAAAAQMDQPTGLGDVLARHDCPARDEGTEAFKRPDCRLEIKTYDVNVDAADNFADTWPAALFIRRFLP